ncbi:unnamed protein product, partial [marine sediment metagenome]
KNSIKKLNVKKWRLLKSSEQINIRKIETIGIPISELFEIRTGLATLKDNLYFVDGGKKVNNYYIKEFNGCNYEIETSITRSVYKISDLRNQDDVKQNTRKIIFPYEIKNNNIQIISKDTLRDVYPKCYKYFKAIKEELLSRDKGKLKVKIWYAYGRSQGLTKTGKKITTPTFSKHPRFLLILEKDAFFTNGYGIYFKDSKTPKDTLFCDIDNNLIAQEKNIDIIQKILNSEVMDYYIRKTSVGIAGGYYCYQKNFIEKFTIPKFKKNEISTLKNFVDKGLINDFLKQKYQVSL